MEGTSPIYAALLAAPEWEDANLNMTTDEVVAALNAALPGAYANPNGSDLNAMLVLMTSPGHAPETTAPVVTQNTRLSPIRTLLFAYFLGSLWIGRDHCRNECKAAYTAALQAAEAAFKTCVLRPHAGAACARQYNALKTYLRQQRGLCYQYCHSQGDNLQDAKNALAAGAN